MLPGSAVGGQLQGGQGDQMARTMLAPPPPTSTNKPQEETLAARLDEVRSFLSQCHGLADGSLAAIGFPVEAELKKAESPLGLAGRVMEIRSQTIELRGKLELLRGALE